METSNIKIGGKYIMGPKIGSGSFGEVYLVNVSGTTQIFALKKQDQRAKHLQLMAEARILKGLEGGIGFAQVYWQGNQGRSNIMVTDLLGPSLQDLYVMCGKRFSLKTTLMFADQFLQRIQWLHGKNYIHRDIKPQNFLMGLGAKSHIVHLIDFGLSKKFRDPKTHQHIPYKQNKNLTGTARYASINAHLGIQQSRRDDLQAIGYVLLYFVEGFLPWQGIRANNKLQKYQKIMQKKMSIPVQVQCRGLPIQFSMYLNYCRSLKFDDKPDYSFLRRLFKELMEKQKYKMDYDYDWCNLDEERQIQSSKIKIQIRKPVNFSEMQEDIQKQEVSQAELVKNRPIDLYINSGQQNIQDSDIIDESQYSLNQKTNKIAQMDLQQKKNRLLYDD